MSVVKMSISLIFVALSSMMSAAQPADFQSRIINGAAVTSGQHHYFVALLYRFNWNNGYHYYVHCGGSHIGDGKIVTAAHCVDGPSDTDLYLLVGNNSSDMTDEFCLQSGSVNDDNYCRQSMATGYADSGYVVYSGAESRLIAVKNSDFKIHPFYREGSFHDDIALLQLEVALSSAALTLPTTDKFKALAKAGRSNSVTVLGHGDVISDDLDETFDGSAMLLEAQLTPKTDAFCAGLSTEFNGNKMVCAGDQDAVVQDTCRGDSGGPLIHNGQLLGIVSSGPRICADPQEPYRIYTDVYQYVDWLESGGTEIIAYTEDDKVIRLGSTAGALSGALWGMLLILLVSRRR